MNLITSRKAWAGTLAAGIAGVLGLTALTASAPADSAKRGFATITMEFDGMSAPHFAGAKKVYAGTPLKIQNNSDPSEIGPHTFTIAKRKYIPHSKQEMKECGKGQLKICKRVAKAHKVDFQHETVGKQLVENGKPGWDKSFTDKKDGDSWFSLEQNENITQVVPVAPGKTLYYFCIIHPEMQGKLRVVAP